MLTLVIGGAASGKSEYAESLVLRSTLPRYYLATMQVWDAECAARVEKHRRMRAAKQFETVECPLHLDAVHLPARGTALLEDLGNLTANELYDPAGAGPQTAQAILSGLDAVYAQCETLIVVSNEVFSGGADYAGDTDRYLLALAQVNNALADGEELLVILAHGGTQMAALERYALPHKDYYEWCGPNAGGFVLDAADWADKRVLHFVKTVQYTRETDV